MSIWAITHSSIPKCLNNWPKCFSAFVHLDGPSHVRTRLFLMKHHSELFSIFETICGKVHTRFNTTIKVFCSDKNIFLIN